MRQSIVLAFFVLSSLTSASALADGPVANRVASTVLSRLSKMGASVTEPFKQALCADPGKGRYSLRPDGIVLNGELDFAKLLPATRATGLMTSVGGFLWLTYAKGEDHISAQAYVMPSAGWSVPGAQASKGAEVPVEASIGLAFNCAANPHESDYFLNVGTGGPLGLNFFFDISVTNLFSKAFLAGDPSNTPRTYGKIMSTVRSTEPALRAALDLVDSERTRIGGAMADRLFSVNVPRWHEDDPHGGRPISHWIAETAKAVQATARNSSSSENLARRVEDFLGRLKQASNDPIDQRQLQVDILSLYQDLGNAIHGLAVSTFPLTISRARRALLGRATSTSVRDFWFERPASNYGNYCRSTDHFIAVKAPVGGRWTKHYFDCLSGSLLSQWQYETSRGFLTASRTFLERADRYRASLGDLTHIVNNTYAQYLTGRPVRPESLNVGGVYTGPVFTGCFGVEVSLVSLAKSGAALFRQASALARSALTTGPSSPSTLVSAMGAAGGSGFPSWHPSASIAYPYEVGHEVQIPLSSLPQSWQTVFSGECAP